MVERAAKPPASRAGLRAAFNWAASERRPRADLEFQANSHDDRGRQDESTPYSMFMIFNDNVPD